MKFKNPPLVELIADFRWTPSSGTTVAVTQSAGQLTPVPLADSVHNESFFSAFAEKISTYGYVKTERLIPNGWPYPVHMPVTRLKQLSSAGQDDPTLYQIGAGLFSAHALPPYSSWEHFKPIIAQGLKILLNSRPKDEQNAPFSTISLRYIDRFTSQLTDNVLPREFIEQILNVRLQLPEVLTSETQDETKINPSLLLKIPLKSNLQMILGINSSNVPVEAGILMDTSVITQSPTNCDSASVMDILETAHESIQRVFVGLTKSIAAKMEQV